MIIKNKILTSKSLLYYIKKYSKIEFFNCTFNEKVIININGENKIIFRECIFNKNVIYKGIFSKIELIKCTFNDIVDFIELEKIFFLKIRFSLFKNIVSITKSNIEKFESSLNQFSESLFFSKISINIITLKSSYYKKIVINDIKNFRQKEIMSDNISDRETARIIKDSFEQQNNIIEANKYYALEMKKREEDLTEGKNFFEWLVFKVHGISSNHSQDWLLALFWIMSFTFSIGTITNHFEEYHISFINLIPAFFIFIMSLIIASLEIEFKNILLIIFGFISYGLYSIISCDFNLYNVTNHINPFSVMNSWDNITFSEFIFKVIIAYLIYQLIISIRQNTRRK